MTTNLSAINPHAFVYKSYPPMHNTTGDYEKLQEIIAENFADFADDGYDEGDILDILDDIEEKNPIYNTPLSIYIEAFQEASGIDSFKQIVLDKCHDFYNKNVIKPIMDKPDKPSFEIASKIADALCRSFNENFIYPLTADNWKIIMDQFETAESIYRMKDSSYKPGYSMLPEYQKEVTSEIDNWLSHNRPLSWGTLVSIYNNFTGKHDSSISLESVVEWAKSNDDFLIIDTGLPLEDAPPIILLNIKIHWSRLSDKYKNPHDQKAS